MHLKTLEIKGFKSFADKTTIYFGQDITGVVGPNGCGKSNIVDAIRWVLGEQKSRELRSEKMSSVIFNGTKQRKPGGVAEVSLTFENSRNVLPIEYQTVTISRLLFRSGESEYRLNNIPCRLKDITTLFLDTGIGSDSYAIIALNMVDDLLSDREQSRRRLFEQAAGISKFKQRKKETLNKLKGTEDDLSRVEDLLFEIDSNLKTLEKQAKRAKKYFELKERYKTLSIEYAVFQIGDFKSSYQEIKDSIEREEVRKVELEAKAATLDASLEKNKVQILDQEKDLSEKQRHLNELIGEIRGKENDKKVLAQKVLFIQQNQNTLFTQIESSRSNMEKSRQDIAYYQKEIEKEKLLEEQLEAQLNEASTVLQNIKESHGSIKSELEEFIAEQQAHERLIFELEKKLAVHNTQKESLRLDIEKSYREIEERRTEVKTLKEKINIQQDLWHDKESVVKTLQAEEEHRLKILERTTTEFEALELKIVNLNRKLDSKRNEYKLTKSLVDNLEGFPESIKFLSKNKVWKASAPLLSDIIYCSEEYRVCVENYLDSYLNYYVVPSLAEAMDAIRLLSNSQKGKANFFLLDEIKGQSPFSLKSQPVGNVISAASVVKTDIAYQPLLDFLLGNVWISGQDNPQTDPSMQENLILISKSGNYVRSRFTITGGSVGLFEGKRIGRKKNLEVLTKEIGELETEGKKLAEGYDLLRRKMNDLKGANQSKVIEKEQDALHALRRDSVGLQTRLENFETFLKDFTSRHTDAGRRIAEIEESDKEIIAELESARKTDEKIRGRVIQMDSSFRAVAEELSEASSIYNQNNIDFIRQQNKIQALKRELDFRTNQFKDLESRITMDTLSTKNAEKDLADTHIESQKLEDDLVKLYAERKSFEQNLNSFEQVYYEGRGSINKSEDELRKMNKSAQDVNELISRLKERFSEIKIGMSSISERLRIEFNVDINEVIQKEPDTTWDKDELGQKVERIKSRLTNYGEVNPMAVEAYDEMKERHDFITSQKTDLLSAKDSLMETIQEIEVKATEKFMEAFEAVREYFKMVFRSLFTEDDDCDLTLADPSDPLESSINIVAKPKGKRPQSINLLSGGEKTLTATALLFSLYLLKPAPFCIFDEVDAPLDDANIGKFNKIVKKFSQDSQFIIVTHNKQTMAAVDVIYGVTMPEQGISRVVPVDFRNLN